MLELEELSSQSQRTCRGFFSTAKKIKGFSTVRLKLFMKSSRIIPNVGLFRKRIPAVFRIRGMQRQSGNG